VTELPGRLVRLPIGERVGDDRRREPVAVVVLTGAGRCLGHHFLLVRIARRDHVGCERPVSGRGDEPAQRQERGKAGATKIPGALHESSSLNSAFCRGSRFVRASCSRPRFMHCIFFRPGSKPWIGMRQSPFAMPKTARPSDRGRRPVFRGLRRRFPCDRAATRRAASRSTFREGQSRRLESGSVAGTAPRGRSASPRPKPRQSAGDRPSSP
jgi:hypothetical protein